MEMSVTVEEKRAFLEWLLRYYPMDSHEMAWFIEEIMVDNRILAHIHFVENITDCPKGIIMTIHPSYTYSFTFFKGKVSTKDVYTAYHEVHLHQQENLFIQVNFPSKQSNYFYQSVLEADELFQQEAKQTAEQLLTELLYSGNVHYLKKVINHALEIGDVEAFMKYSEQLKQLKQIE